MSTPIRFKGKIARNKCYLHEITPKITRFCELVGLEMNWLEMKLTSSLFWLDFLPKVKHCRKYCVANSYKFSLTIVEI